MTKESRAGVRCVLALAGFLAVVAACGSGDGTTAPPADSGAPAPAPTTNGEPAPAPSPTAAPTPAPTTSAPAPIPPATGVRVSFKVDPRITQGHYHGDRWVSPPSFTLIVQAASPVVNARAHFAQDGGMIDASATWTAANPSMIAISPGEGHEVAITILAAGQSAVTVATEQGSRELAVTAAHDAGNWHVEVAQ